MELNADTLLYVNLKPRNRVNIVVAAALAASSVSLPLRSGALPRFPLSFESLFNRYSVRTISFDVHCLFVIPMKRHYGFLWAQTVELDNYR